MNDDEGAVDDDGGLIGVRPSDSGNTDRWSLSTAARFGCAAPLVVLGSAAVFVAVYLSPAVLDAGRNTESPYGSCSVAGASSFLGSLVLLGVGVNVVAALLVRRGAAASTWGRLLVLVAVPGLLSIAFGLYSGEHCPLLN